MHRRQALVSLAAVGASMAVGGCAAQEPPADRLSEAELGHVLQSLAGYELRPGEAPKVLASLAGSRFTAVVDPTVQPQADFDADVDA